MPSDESSEVSDAPRVTAALACPCGRLLWQRPGADAHHVYRPDPHAPNVHPHVNASTSDD
jgi:hypothetical protein